MRYAWCRRTDIRSSLFCLTGSSSHVYYFYQVNFEEGDRRNPANFSRREKWIITAIACFVTLISCNVLNVGKLRLKALFYSVSCLRISYGIQLDDTRPRLHVSTSHYRSQCLHGGIWISPSRNGSAQRRTRSKAIIHCYSTHSFRHVCDDRIVSIFLQCCPIIDPFTPLSAKNIQTVIIGRLIQGCAGSTGGTMAGGTIADIWSPKE